MANITGCNIICQMPSHGAIITGFGGTAPEAVTITGNSFGKGDNTYLSLRVDDQCREITYGGNVFHDWGGGEGKIENTALPGELCVYGQRSQLAP